MSRKVEEDEMRRGERIQTQLPFVAHRGAVARRQAETVELQNAVDDLDPRVSPRTPSMTWIHACRPGPSLCARLAPAVIRLAKTLASWWIVTTSSPPFFPVSSSREACSPARVAATISRT